MKGGPAATGSSRTSLSLDLDLDQAKDLTSRAGLSPGTGPCDPHTQDPMKTQRYISFAAPFFGIVTASAATQTWKLDGASDIWNTSHFNWDAGVPWSLDNSAIFAGSGEVITIDNVSAAALTISGNGYSFTGGSLSLVGALPPVDVAATISATINTPILGTGGMTKTGDGTLILTGTNSYTGPTKVNVGTLRIGDGAAAGSINKDSPVFVESGATVEWARNSNVGVIENPVSSGGTWRLQGDNATNALQQGLFNLQGDNSGFTGTLLINRASTWDINSNARLGSGTIHVQDRGTLGMIGGVDAANTIYIENGAGWHHNIGADAVIGAIRADKTNTLSGSIILNQNTGVVLGDNTGANSVLGCWTDGFLTLSGVISGTGELSMSRYTAWNGGNPQVVNIDITGTSSNTYTGKTVVDGQGARASMHLMKTGGAVAVQGGTTVQLGSATGGQANLRMGDRAATGAGRSAWDNQFGTNNGGVVLNAPNVSGNWMRMDLLGTNQTLAGVIGGTSTSQSGGVIQNEGLTSLGLNPGKDSTLTLMGSGEYLFNGLIRDEDDAGTANKINIAKTGTGTQTLCGGISYTGTTSITGGTLQIGAGSNNGTLGNNSVTTVTSPGTLKFYRNDLNVVIGNAISGNGPILFAGTGTSLQSDYRPTGIGSGYTGTITVDKARLQVFTSGVNFGNAAAINVLDGAGIGLGFSSGPTISTPLNLAGAGWVEGGTLGALRVENGATVTGPVTLTAAATIGTTNSAAGGTVSGNIATGGFDLTLFNGGSGDLNISGVIGGNGGVIKTGGNKVTLSGANTYIDETVVNAGALFVTGSTSNSSEVTVAAAGTLGGTGTVGGETVVNGTLAPGVNAIGTLGFNLTVGLASGSTYAVEIASLASHDKITAGGALTAAGSLKLILSGYTPVAGDTFDIVDAASITGTPALDPTSTALPEGLEWDFSGFATNGSVKVVVPSEDPFEDWADDNNVTLGKAGDDDGDGVNNLLEFATAANPKSGSSFARAYPRVHSIGGQNVLTYTVAVRAGATFAANGSKQRADKDGVRYDVEASDNLGTWNSVVVTELAPGDAAAVQAALGSQLNGLDAAWQWHSFRTDGHTAVDPSDFIRVGVSETP